MSRQSSPELEAVFPGGENAVCIGPVPGVLQVLAAPHIQRPGFLNAAPGLHPLPASGGGPPEQCIHIIGVNIRILVILNGQVPLSLIGQGVGATVAVRLRHGKDDFPVFGALRPAALVPIDEEDPAPGAVAPLRCFVPVAGEHIGIHTGKGGKTPFTHFRLCAARFGPGVELQAVRLPPCEAQAQLPLRFQDGIAHGKPVNVRIGNGEVEAPPGIRIARAVNMGPEVAGKEDGFVVRLPAGEGGSWGRGHVFPCLLQLPDALQEACSAPVAQGPPQGAVPVQVPVFPDLKEQPMPLLAHIDIRLFPGGEGAVHPQFRIIYRFRRLRVDEQPIIRMQ